MNTARIRLIFILLSTPAPLSLFAARGGDNFLFNDVAVKVNNENISIREVENVYADSYILIQDKLKRGELSAASVNDAIKLAWTDALDQAIQDRLLDQRANARRKEIINYYLQRAGAAVGQDKAYEMFKRLEDEYTRKLEHDKIAAAGGEEELRKALQRRGQTFAQWRENLSKELFRLDIIAMELGPINVRPHEVKEYYEKHKDEFGQAEAWRLRRIRIAKSRFKEADVALAAAKKTKESIEGGKDFAEAAAAVSDDPMYAKGGGLMTRNGQTDLPSGVFPGDEKIAAGLKDGGVSEPIDAGDWYVLVQRLGHQERREKRFDEVSDRVENMVMQEKIRSKKKEMQEKLKRTSYVEIIQKDPPEHLMAK